MTHWRPVFFSAIMLAAGLALAGPSLAGAQDQQTPPSDQKSCSNACGDSCAAETESSQDREAYTKCMKACLKKCKDQSKLLLNPG